MISIYHNKILRCFGSGMLMLTLLVFTYGPTPHTPRAEAQDAVVVVGGPGTEPEKISAIENTITAVKTAFSAAADFVTAKSQLALVAKEFALDKIAWDLANLMLKHISRSIVQWINSGFQGSPAFVTDFRGFLLDVADQEAGAFLTEIGLGFMCSPFRLDVQLALAIQYQQARTYDDQCRLSDIVGNVEGFFAGDLSQGGWEGWFQLTTQPANNPYGALLLAQHELGVRITNAQGEGIKLLDFGSGFLSFETCTPINDDAPEEDPVCSISTPGKVIEDQLNNTLGTGQRRLEVANEINEILSALFSQLVVQAFTGAGGLLGLTSSGFSSEGFSYLEAATAASPVAEDSNVGLVNNTQNPIKTSLDTEVRYLELQEEIVARIDDAENHESLTYGTTVCSQRTLPGRLQNARTAALEEIDTAVAVINTLEILDADFEAAQDPRVHQTIMDNYFALENAGVLHTEIDNVDVEIQVIGNAQRGLIADINSFTSAVDNDCREFFRERGEGGTISDNDSSEE